MKIGYARVSNPAQNIESQKSKLVEFGCEKIFSEKKSGTNSDRVELNKLLEQIRADDVIVVTELSRLSRSTKDLFTLIEKIQGKGADLKSLREPWLDTTTPQGKLMFTFFAGISQFERDIISSRTKDGLAYSKEIRGKKTGRKRSQKRIDNYETVLALYKDDISVVSISKKTGLGRSTIYRILREHYGSDWNSGNKET